MTESEWLACEQPDLLLEVIEGTMTRDQLVEFVRRCWESVAAYVPERSAVTAADQFAALAPGMSDHDAVLYAAEAALKAAGLAPSLRAEQRRQAALLRQLVRRSFR